MQFAKLIQASITFVVILFAWGSSLAQYPVRPIRIVVPYPPGGSSDTLVRTLAPSLESALKQPVVVENRPGASGTIGAEYVARQPADGYTLLLIDLSSVFIPFVYTNLRYKPFEDFAGVALLADQANVLVVNSRSPFQSLSDIAAAERSKPGSVSFASGGAGTPSHLACEMVNHQLKLKMVHVPYKGNAPAANDLLGGQIPVMCSNLGATLPLMNGGQVRILAQTGKTRTSYAPHVPLFAEQGVQGLDSGLWSAIAAPKDTPREVLLVLNQAVRSALDQKNVKDKLATMGATTLDPSLEAYQLRVEYDRKAWEPVLRTLDLKTN